MKTTHGKAYGAFEALTKIGNSKIPAGTAYDLYLLKKKLTDSVEFQQEEKRKMIDQYGGRIEPDGKIVFEEKGKGYEYIQAVSELLSGEIEIDFEPIHLSVESLKEISISEIEGLEGFVEIEKT